MADQRQDEKPAPPTYQDWVRAIRERDAQQQPKRKTRRSGY